MPSDIFLWVALSFAGVLGLGWVLLNLKLDLTLPPGHLGRDDSSGVREPRVPKPLVGVGADAKQFEDDD